MSRPIEDLMKLLDGVPWTFSRWCISGLVSDCKCWRCLKEHEIEATEETERAAEERSKIESAKFRERAMESFRQAERSRDADRG